MFIPGARDLVEITGLPGLFLVLWVNRLEQRADVLAMMENPYAMTDVPFARLLPYQEYPDPDGVNDGRAEEVRKALPMGVTSSSGNPATARRWGSE